MKPIALFLWQANCHIQSLAAKKLETQIAAMAFLNPGLTVGLKSGQNNCTNRTDSDHDQHQTYSISCSEIRTVSYQKICCHLMYD
jgi:hypothetical protein